MCSNPCEFEVTCFRPESNRVIVNIDILYIDINTLFSSFAVLSRIKVYKKTVTVNHVSRDGEKHWKTWKSTGKRARLEGMDVATDRNVDNMSSL